MNYDQLAPDSTLGIIVGTANGTKNRWEDGPGLLLTLSGMMVSGKLMPGWQWYEEVEKQLRDAYVAGGGDPENEDAGWAKLFKDIGQRIQKQRDEEDAAADAAEGLASRYQKALAEQSPTAFIHLRDARIYAPGQEGVPGKGMHWRGRLSEIAGWSFILLGTATQHDL